MYRYSVVRGLAQRPQAVEHLGDSPCLVTYTPPGSKRSSSPRAPSRWNRPGQVLHQVGPGNGLPGLFPGGLAEEQHPLFQALRPGAQLVQVGGVEPDGLLEPVAQPQLLAVRLVAAGVVRGLPAPQVPDVVVVFLLGDQEKAWVPVHLHVQLLDKGVELAGALRHVPLGEPQVRQGLLIGGQHAETVENRTPGGVLRGRGVPPKHRFPSCHSSPPVPGPGALLCTLAF